MVSWDMTRGIDARPHAIARSGDACGRGESAVNGCVRAMVEDTGHKVKARRSNSGRPRVARNSPRACAPTSSSSRSTT